MTLGDGPAAAGGRAAAVLNTMNALISVSDKAGIVELAQALHAAGVRSARKHIGWYVRDFPEGEAFRAEMNAIEDCEGQVAAVHRFFDALAAGADRMPAAPEAHRVEELVGNDA